MNQFASIIKKERIAKGWNKSQMARFIGISSQLYGQYERGKNPGGDFFIKWKDAFGKDLTSEIETNVSREIIKNQVTTIENPADAKEYLKNNPGKKLYSTDLNKFLAGICKLARCNIKIQIGYQPGIALLQGSWGLTRKKISTRGNIQGFVLITMLLEKICMHYSGNFAIGIYQQRNFI